MAQMTDASFDASGTRAVLYADGKGQPARSIQGTVYQAPIQSKVVPSRMSYAVIGTKPDGSASRNHRFGKL